jgi:hypothetical protein
MNTPVGSTRPDVRPPVVDVLPPVVSVSAPVAGAVVSGSAVVSAEATDNVGVVGVQFKLDGNDLGAEQTRAPYSVVWDTSLVANGRHTLTAVARDAAGNSGVASAVVVTVSNVAGPVANGVVAAYGFNEGIGTLLADGSGQGNNGVVRNTVWSSIGRNGGALAFDGATSWVTIPDSASLALSTALTLEAWVDPAALTPGWRTVLFKEQPFGIAYSLYAAQAAGLPVGQVLIVGEQNATAAAGLPLNSWSHLALTYDGSTLSLYVNGALAATTPVGGTVLTSSGPLRIGGNSIWNEWFKGLIDDVRVYNRPLSATEIQTDMNTPVR